MRRGAANSKRMCIICHYLIAQNGDACTSFFDTLVGSVNNNARDQVQSVCPIHFSVDHSSDKLISFSTRNCIVKKLFFSPRLGHKFGVRPIRGCGLYAGKYGIPLNGVVLKLTANKACSVLLAISCMTQLTTPG